MTNRNMICNVCHQSLSLYQNFEARGGSGVFSDISWELIFANGVSIRILRELIFLELCLTKDFVGINFCESALYKDFAGVNFAFFCKEYFFHDLNSWF